MCWQRMQWKFKPLNPSPVLIRYQVGGARAAVVEVVVIARDLHGGQGAEWASGRPVGTCAGYTLLGWINGEFKSGDKGIFSIWDASWGNKTVWIQSRSPSVKHLNFFSFGRLNNIFED